LIDPVIKGHTIFFIGQIGGKKSVQKSSFCRFDMAIFPRQLLHGYVGWLGFHNQKIQSRHQARTVCTRFAMHQHRLVDLGK